jgi:hypothetical protein
MKNKIIGKYVGTFAGIKIYKSVPKKKEEEEHYELCEFHNNISVDKFIKSEPHGSEC